MTNKETSEELPVSREQRLELMRKADEHTVSCVEAELQTTLRDPVLSQEKLADLTRRALANDLTDPEAAARLKAAELLMKSIDPDVLKETGGKQRRGPRRSVGISEGLGGRQEAPEGVSDVG